MTAYFLGGVVVVLILAFAALGLHDTLTGDAGPAYRIGMGLLRLTVIAFAGIGLLDTLLGSALTGIRALGASGRSLPVTHPGFRTTMELLTGTPLTSANTVHVLLNGDATYPQLWADLRGAQRSIVVQLYYCEPGRMAAELQGLLMERARAGVKTFVLVDAFGANAMPRDWFDGLTAAGVEVARFRPIHWYSLNRANNRSHVRAIAIDGAIGYTGGFGIADKWFGDGRSPGQWRETNVRFTGPAVSQLLAAFAIGWAEATGDLITADVSIVPTQPAAPSTGSEGVMAGLLHTPPSLGITRAERFRSLSISSARRSLYITNAYFVPDRTFRHSLVDAATRGVDVRILTAGPTTDVGIMLYGGRARYAELLAAGVRIYEYQPVMMHAKTMVVDGEWSSIGSMNFDNRSMVLNDESNLIMLDAETGAQMDQIFRDDLRFSREVTSTAFAQRPWWDKLREQVANLLTRLL